MGGAPLGTNWEAGEEKRSQLKLASVSADIQVVLEGQCCPASVG